MRFPANLLRAILLALLSASLSSGADSTRFLVFPLEDLTKVSALDWLREGIAEAITDQIRLPGIQTSSYEERFRFIEDSDLPPNAPLSRASMIRVGQQAGADYIIMGVFSGPADNLKIVLSVLNIRSMKLSGDIVAKGSLSALPQMENELAWNILGQNGLNKNFSRAMFNTRVRAVPNIPYSLYIRGLRSATENEQVQLWSRAAEMQSNFPQARYLLGRYYYQNGDCQKAIRYLDPARDLEQTYLRAEFMLGSCYLQQNSFPSAIKSFSQILALTRPVEVLNNLGVAYLRAGNLTLASQNLAEARNRAKSNPTVSLNLALVQHLQDNDPAACDILLEAVKAYPNNGMLQYALNVIKTAQGDAQGAVAALTEARRLGIDIEKLQREEPKAWARILTVWEMIR